MMVKSIQSGTTTTYIYRGHDPVCEKSGSTYTDYVYVNGKVKLKLVGADTYFHFQDALGSTWQVWRLGAPKVGPLGHDLQPVRGTGLRRGRHDDGLCGVPVAGQNGLYYVGVRRYDSELEVVVAVVFRVQRFQHSRTGMSPRLTFLIKEWMDEGLTEEALVVMSCLHAFAEKRCLVFSPHVTDCRVIPHQPMFIRIRVVV